MWILATKIYRDGHPQTAPHGNQKPHLPFHETPDGGHDTGQAGRAEAEPKHTDTVRNSGFEFDLDFRDFLETEHFEALRHFREFQSYDCYEYLDAMEMIKSLTWIR